MGRNMVKSNLKTKKVESKANLKVVKENGIKTTSYSDINLKAWRDYNHIKTDNKNGLQRFASRFFCLRQYDFIV